MSTHVLEKPRRVPTRIDECLPTLRMIESPRTAHRVARIVFAIFLMLPFILLLVPWQQSLWASGRVIAFDPTERQQTIEAPIDGRIVNWYVREGDRVQKGDPLVSMEDPDPALPERLKRQKAAVEERKRSATERRNSYAEQMESLKRSQTEALAAAQRRYEMGQQRLTAAEQALTAAKRTLDVADTNFKMEAKLRPLGLNSQLAYLRAEQDRDVRLADFERSKAAVEAAKSEVEALKADLGKIRNDAQAAILNATASWQMALAELGAAERDIAEIETRIARQETQDIRSPCDGVVFRVLCNSRAGGMLVKAGNPLLIIVPDISEPDQKVVELFVEGNDAPLITELFRARMAEGEDVNIPVRIQFEGWPAIQFVGWPSAAVGTFGGIIAFVDPHDDGKGKFRILVRPDPDEEEFNPWPTDFSLRQGVRASGWVLLNRVTIGWELWRRLNGFPPVVAPKDPYEQDKKPGKVKVPK